MASPVSSASTRKRKLSDRQSGRPSPPPQSSLKSEEAGDCLDDKPAEPSSPGSVGSTSAAASRSEPPSESESLPPSSSNRRSSSPGSPLPKRLKNETDVVGSDKQDSPDREQGPERLSSSSSDDNGDECRDSHEEEQTDKDGPASPLTGSPSNRAEQPPEPEDDGWEPLWDASAQAYYFYNRFTAQSQWENPRIQAGDGRPPEPSVATLAGGGYNPAIHGDYDPNADYAVAARQTTGAEQEAETEEQRQYRLLVGRSMIASGSFVAPVSRAGPSTGKEPAADPATVQLNSYFDVDQASTSHDGRSLKAERAGRKLSKAEVKAFRRKKDDRKKEKQRAWLRS